MSIVDESGTDGAKCHMKMMSGRKVANAIRSLKNAKCLQLDYARVLHKELLMPVLLYYSETMVWSRKEGSRIRPMQMDNLKGFIGY